jgi:hypothetical protein
MVPRDCVKVLVKRKISLLFRGSSRRVVNPDSCCHARILQIQGMYIQGKWQFKERPLGASMNAHGLTDGLSLKMMEIANANIAG